MKYFGEIDNQSYLLKKKKYPITFNLIVFCNYVYILFPRVDFCSSNFNKDDLKQDQKEEGRSKAKKIIVEGNLNSSFVFCFKEHFNFVVFRISLQG